MAYMEPKVKTFIQGKLVKGPAKIGGEYQQSSGIAVIPEISPGPGDYLSLAQTSTIKANAKPHHLQFFGSTVDRTPFYEKNNNKSDINSDFRGPGTYEISYGSSNIPRENKFHKGSSSSFISGRDKDLLFAGNQNPAPGDYKTVNGVNRLNGKVWSKISTFGSTEKRFKEVIIENPGPGAYSTVRRDRKKKSGSGYNFKSGTIRNVFNLELQENVEILNLQDYKSIANQISHLSGGAPNNFTILKNERYVMPFNS
jgi:hypothetical protein